MGGPLRIVRRRSGRYIEPPLSLPVVWSTSFIESPILKPDREMTLTQTFIPRERTDSAVFAIRVFRILEMWMRPSLLALKPFNLQNPPYVWTPWISPS